MLARYLKYELSSLKTLILFLLGRWKQVLLKTLLFIVLALLIASSNPKKQVFRMPESDGSNKNDSRAFRFYEDFNVSTLSASVWDLKLARFFYNLTDNKGFFDSDFYCPTFTLKSLMEEVDPLYSNMFVFSYAARLRFFPYEMFSLGDKTIRRPVLYGEIKERLQLLEQAGQERSFEARQFAAMLRCWERDPGTLNIYAEVYPDSYYVVTDEQGEDRVIRLKRDRKGKFLRSTLEGIDTYLELSLKRFRGPYEYKNSPASLPFSAEKLFLLATLNWFIDPITQEKILYQRLEVFEKVQAERDRLISRWEIEQQEKREKESARKDLLLERLESRLKRMEQALERIENKL